ncbi:hypothetical protein [Natrialba sp. INN-245]|uniref:hypothetical protein n=1 Tax=Natrialba sp. INN-245 TaxID=2690967 RepID=UPI00131164B9|nr:hypothetical protein [Natrialba sp. INN-245]MWV40133.1 hypothetical protein [Natrialba sp. INN-245]
MTDEPNSDEIQNQRDDALAVLSDITEQARYKSLGDGRIRSPEKERIRIKYLRLIVQSQGERRKILRDKELEELEERLARIEERQGIEQ